MLNAILVDIYTGRTIRAGIEQNIDPIITMGTREDRGMIETAFQYLSFRHSGVFDGGRVYFSVGATAGRPGAAGG